MKRLLLFLALIFASLSFIKVNAIDNVTNPTGGELWVDPPEIFINVGESKQVNLYKKEPPDNIQQNITNQAVWRSDNLQIASANNGLINGLTPGDTVVHIDYNGLVRMVNVHVLNNTNPNNQEWSLFIEPGPLYLDLNNNIYGYIRVYKEIRDANGTVNREDVTNRSEYFVDNPMIAEPDAFEKGKIKAKGVGNTQLRISFEGRMINTNVTVEGEMPWQLIVEPNILNLDLANKPFGYVKVYKETTSSDGMVKKEDVTNESNYIIENVMIAEADGFEKGKIKAKNKGNTKLKVEYKGKVAYVNINVVGEQPWQLRVEPKDITLDLNSKPIGYVRVYKETTGTNGFVKKEDVTNKANYFMENPMIAEPDGFEKGKIKAKSIGNTQLKVEYEGKVEYVNVNVKGEMPWQLRVEPKDITLDLNSKPIGYVRVYKETTDTNGFVKKEDVTNKANYFIENPMIAEPDGFGKGTIKAKSIGNTLLKVEYEGKVEYVNINVKGEEKWKLRVDSNNIHLDLNSKPVGYIKVYKEITDASGFTKREDVTNKANYFMENLMIAEPDGFEKGKIKAKSQGNTKLKVEYEGQIEYVNIHVKGKEEEENIAKITPYHNWTIEFNILLDENSINNNTIYVKDSLGTKIKTNVSVNENLVIVDAPTNGYKVGQTYTLFISTEVCSKNKVNLKNDVNKSFLIVADSDSN